MLERIVIKDNFTCCGPWILKNSVINKLPLPKLRYGIKKHLQTRDLSD